MSTEPWPIEESSLAFGLIVNFIQHQVDTGVLPRADAAAILGKTVNGADNLAARSSVRHKLKQTFPGLNF